MSLKILQICPKPLFPPWDGGKLAMQNLAEGLVSNGAELIQLMLESPGHRFPEKADSNSPIHRIFIDTRIKPFHALVNLLGTESYHLTRFRQKSFRDGLLNLLKAEKFDVIQGEGLYTLGYLDDIRRHSKAFIVLRAHNVEHLIWERASRTSRNPALSFYLRLQSKRLKQEEYRIARAVDGMAVMSKEDLMAFRRMGVDTKACVIGIGTQLQPPKPLPDPTLGKDIFHLGAMNWFPNREGVNWFLQSVWPELQTAIPGIRFYLAGHGMPEGLKHREKDGVFVQEAEDAATFMLSHGLMVVPLLSGSGIRVKIIEGMKLGKLIVTTPIGAEGLGVEDGKQVLIASSAKEFVEKISLCFRDPAFARKISENACNFAAEHFDTARLAEQLLRFYPF